MFEISMTLRCSESQSYTFALANAKWKVHWVSELGWVGLPLSPCCGESVRTFWDDARVTSEHLRCSPCGQRFLGEVSHMQDLVGGTQSPWDLALYEPDALTWWLEDCHGMDGLSSEVWRSTASLYTPGVELQSHV